MTHEWALTDQDVWKDISLQWVRKRNPRVSPRSPAERGSGLGREQSIFPAQRPEPLASNLQEGRGLYKSHFSSPSASDVLAVCVPCTSAQCRRSQR